MLISLLLGAAVIAVPSFEVDAPEPAQAPIFVPPPAPPQPARDPIITGLGRLELTLKPQEIADQIVKAGNAFNLDLDLLINRDGSIESCESVGRMDYLGLAGPVCAELETTARYRMYAAEVMPVPKGVTSVHVNFGLRPQLPATIAFTAKGAGLAARIFYRAERSGQFPYCDVSAGTVIFTDAEERQVCSAFYRSTAFRALRGTNGGEIRQDNSRNVIHVWLAQDHNRPGGETYTWSEKAPWNTGPYTYPPNGSESAPRLSHSDGRVILGLAEDDYPPAAMRYDLEGSSVVDIGFDATGTVKACHPVSSTRASVVLDQATCKVVFKRAHFSYADVTAPRSALAYVQQRIRWELPR